MTPRQRVVLVLLHRENLPGAEAAQMPGCSVRAVKNLVRLGLSACGGGGERVRRPLATATEDSSGAVPLDVIEQRDQTLRRRMTELSGPKWHAFKDDIELVACTYPDIVALAGLFASPHLRFLPFTGKEGDLRRFIREVRERAATGYSLDAAGKRDPLIRRIEEEPSDRSLPFYPWRPPGRPAPEQVSVP